MRSNIPIYVIILNPLSFQNFITSLKPNSGIITPMNSYTGCKKESFEKTSTCTSAIPLEKFLAMEKGRFDKRIPGLF
ncbi:MAG: hypothetical protein WDO19_26890 [Bacteroidota bacterium]